MPRRFFSLTLSLLILFAATRQPRAYAQDDPPEEPQPLVVLVEFDPEAFRLARPNPTFVLYVDGTVIYRPEAVAPDATAEPSEEAVDTGYRTFQLSEEALADFLTALNFEAFDDLDINYRREDLTDPIRNYIQMWQDDDSQRVWVEGDLRNDQADRDAAPADYLTVFDQLIAFVAVEHPEARLWTPETLGLRLDGNDTLYPDEQVAVPGGEWPSDWPNDGDPTFHLIEGRFGYGYVELPGSQYAAAVEFLRTHANAVQLAGETYRATLILTFPNDVKWWEDITGPG